MRGVLTVVLPSTLILTTEGITFSSIGARLGICCAVAAEETVSAALADRGDNAKPKLRASALIAKVVFFMFLNLDLQVTHNCCVYQIRFDALSSGIKFLEKVKIYCPSLQNSALFHCHQLAVFIPGI